MDVANVLSAHGIGEAMGNATPAQVLVNQTFSTTALINAKGTMPNNGSPTLQPGQSIAPGYYSGGSVANDFATGTATPTVNSWTQSGLPITPSRLVLTDFTDDFFFDSALSTTQYWYGGAKYSCTVSFGSGTFTFNDTAGFGVNHSRNWIALK